jgi:hypothetical protein
MKRTVLVLTLALAPLAARAQDPIHRPVKLEELSSMYQEHSESESNREFSITKAAGSAQAAIGTDFTRDGTTFRILKSQERQDTYDAVKSTTFQRVVYSARQLIEIQPPCPVKELKPEGQELLVTIDYRPLQPASFEAYVAEVSRRRTGERWEFVKVTP